MGNGMTGISIVTRKRFTTQNEDVERYEECFGVPGKANINISGTTTVGIQFAY